jgi:hypothetical protein
MQARAGYAAAGVRPPDKIEQIDALNRLLTGKSHSLKCDASQRSAFEGNPLVFSHPSVMLYKPPNDLCFVNRGKGRAHQRRQGGT